MNRFRLILNAAVYTVGGLLPQAINVLLLPVFTRYLSKPDFGILSYTSAVTAWLGILGSLTLHTYLLRNYYACKTDLERRSLFSTLFSFLCVYNAILLGIECLVLPPIFSMFHMSVPFAPYFQLALTATALETAAIIPLALFRVREQPWRFVLLATTATALNAGLSLYFVVGRGAGVLGRYYGQLGADVVMILVYALIIYGIGGFAFERNHIRAAFRFCLPLVPAQLLATFDSISDRLVLERFVSLDRMGIYAVALSLASGLTLLSSGMFRALEPSVYRMANENTLESRIGQIKLYVLVGIAGAGSILILLSRPLVSILAGPQFSESARVLSILLVAGVFRGFSNLFSTYLLAVGVVRFEPIVRAAVVVTGVGASLILTPRFGIYGAAWAAVASSIAGIAAFSWALAAVGNVRWTLVRDVAATACVLAVAWILSEAWYG